MSYGASSFGVVSYGADVVIAAAGGNSQSLAITLDSVVVAISQKEQHSQSLAITLSSITASINQTEQHSQSLAATLADITASINQVANHSQSLAATLADITANVSQTLNHNQLLTHSQALLITLDSVLAGFTQTLNHSQYLAATLDDVSFNAVQVGAASVSVGGGYDYKTKKKYVVKINDKLVLFKNEKDAKFALDLNQPTIDNVVSKKSKKEVKLSQPEKVIDLYDVRAIMDKSRVDYLLTMKHLDFLVKEYEDAQDEQDIEDMMMLMG